MLITAEQHETIHKILDQMLVGINGYPGYIFLYEGNRELGISEEDGQFLREVMQQAGLITNADGPTQNHISELTAKGKSIARAPGGYRAYIRQQAQQREQQQQQEQEQLTLTRQGTAAAVSSAKSSKVSAWVAVVSVLVAIVAAYIAYQANAGTNEVSARLQRLEAQVQQLKHK